MNVTRSAIVPLGEVLGQTPDGKIAMFQVTSITSKIDDSMLGEIVYIHRGKICDFMSDTEHGHVGNFGLNFLRYVDR